MTLYAGYFFLDFLCHTFKRRINDHFIFGENTISRNMNMIIAQFL